jgi:hypothetical protein
MSCVSRRVVPFAAILLVLSAHAASLPAKAQQSSFAGVSDAPVSANSTLVGDPSANEIVSKVLLENKRRNELLQSYAVTRTYEIRTHEGKLAAKTVVRMEYRAPDIKTFEKTSEKGSGIVRHMVFDRLMDSEGETASGKQHQDSALTPANYEFRFVGEDQVGSYHCLVLDVAPRRKDRYLFEGRVWIESHDFAVVRIAGHPAKKPSFWINRADFVREYQKVDEFWLPLRDETQVEVKIYGKRVLTIDHGPYVLPSVPQRAVDQVN